MLLYDLHTHSDISDGTLSPSALVQEAYKAGLTALALTDHDATAGCAEAAEEAQRLGIRFIPGVEISGAEYNELHILGLGIDTKDEALAEEMQKCNESRRDHVRNICRILEDKGLDLDAEKIISSARYSVGKPHIANEMIAKGFVSSPKEAFDKYLECREIKDLKKYKIGYEKAADLIHGAGGIVVLAHPHKIEFDDGTELADFIENFDGLDALEAFYSEHDVQQTGMLVRLAEKLDLLISCGSDFHGKNKAGIELGRGICDSIVTISNRFAIDAERLVVNDIL